jgi:CheY-like chemotaxis protein
MRIVPKTTKARAYRGNAYNVAFDQLLLRVGRYFARIGVVLLERRDQRRDDGCRRLVTCNGGYVLIIEDDLYIEKALVDIIGTDYGHNVRTAPNGLEALRMLKAAPPPALILLDLMMPRMDGAEFIGRKNKHPSLANVPVCIMTANKNGDSELARLAMAGPRRCSILRKPFDLEELMAIVERHC